MKLKMLYEMSINALNKERGLYKFCNKIKPDRINNVLYSYHKIIFESRTGEGIFWILPNKDGVFYLAFFPEEHYGDNLDHESLWNKHVVPLIGDQFNIDSIKINNLFEAFPRGRLELGDSIDTYRIGFGGDYPPGWDENKLFERLKVSKDNCELEIDEHWEAKPKHLAILKSLINRR